MGEARADGGPADRHNALTGEFVQRLGRDCASYSELMVVLESMLLGAMLLNVKLHGCTPHVASGLVEAAVQSAIERFSAKMEGR